MTTLSEPASTPPARAAVDRRLHPLSWLFVLIQQLKSFALPLVVLLLTGRGNSQELYGLYGVGVLVVMSVVRYFTYRFRLDQNGIVIRSGLLQTTSRDIPYERIHNVSLHQSLFHRLCGVAELRLESAGGGKAEAEMRVLSVADAQALELLIRQRGAAAATEQDSTGGMVAPAPAATLLAMDTGEVVRLGLISNRGMVLVAAAFGAMWQFLPEPWMSDRGFRQAYGFFTREAATLVPEWLLRPAGAVIVTVIFAAGIVLVLRALSVVLALLQFHGFRLEEVGRQLRVERGLLTRVRTHVPRRRIQAWRLHESVLHRWFGRQSLRVDSAAGDPGREQQGLRDLAPIAHPDAIETLIRRVLRSEDWPPPDWRPLHASAWRRLFVVPTIVLMMVSAALTWQFGRAGLLTLALLPILVVRARSWARHAGFAEGARLIAVRTGWLSRNWQFTEIRKLQSLWITASPIDRRHGTATLWLDTAGVSTRDGTLRIPFMPASEARALYDRLAAGMDGGAQLVPPNGFDPGAGA